MLRREVLRHGHGWQANLYWNTPWTNVYGLKLKEALVIASAVKNKH
jgi:hypothetical protein